MGTNSGEEDAAARVFHTPELLELVLISLPQDTLEDMEKTRRLLLLSRTSTRTWHNLLSPSCSPLLRQILYLPNPISTSLAYQAWSLPSRASSAPRHPNHWIPLLLLNYREWGLWGSGFYPIRSRFHSLPDPKNSDPFPPRFWTFHLRFTRQAYSTFPRPGSWRDMLVSEPPFRGFWYSRSVYGLKTGVDRFAPTHLDYDSGLPNARQKFVRRRVEGVTLGMIVDAVVELFEMDPKVKEVMIESLALADDGEDEELVGWSVCRPTTGFYSLGYGAEEAKRV